MKIFSRWPTLALVSGCGGIIVQASIVVQEVMAQVNMHIQAIRINIHDFAAEP